jgi:hypothetical protein
MRRITFPDILKGEAVSELPGLGGLAPGVAATGLATGPATGRWRSKSGE